MCHVLRTCNKYIYSIKVNCVGVVPELGAHTHWSCDELRAGALLSHQGPLGAMVKITQREVRMVKSSFREYRLSDILRQVDEVMKLFAMEKELRIIKNRGHFPVPVITPQGMKIETLQDKKRVLDAKDTEVIEMIKAVRESEENYEREQEEAKNRDQQLRLTRQTNRSDFNFLTMINSTPIRNGNTRTDQLAIHFDTNTICHFYPPSNSTTNGDRYEPPANDSIIQGAGSAPGGQFATNTTSATGCNEPWRYNKGTNTATHTNPQARTTRPSSHNSFHNNLPNSSDNRNGPTCGEQGHMRMDCKERFFCTHCRTANHDTKACKKHHNSTPSPTNSHISAGYYPTATPPPLMGAAAAVPQHNKQVQPTTDHCSRTYLTPTNLEPAPPSTHHSTRHPQHHQPA